jgi:hypothetical protein
VTGRACRVTRRAGLAIGTLAATLGGLPPGLEAQLGVSAYTLGVGSYAAESDFLPAGSAWFGRGRLMFDYSDTWFSAEAAYEHLVQNNPSGGGFGFTNPGGSRVSTDWLPLDWTIYEDDRTSWRHRLDRLSVRASRGPIEVTVGRQAISWATTLFLTPSDPFAPFDPSDPFREYRGGVDAVRIRGFAGPFTEIEAVVRPADTPTGTTMTALGRIGTSKRGWAFGGWAGVLHDDPAAALFTSGALGSTSLRAEVALRENEVGDAVLRTSVGLDHFYRPGSKDLYVLGEIQYDGYGAATPEELFVVATSEPFGRGDMQVLGRWTLATQASYQIHPLVGIDGLTLINLDDLSVLFAPGVSWSTSASATTRLGMFLGVGDAAPTSMSLGSEYGSVPALGYLSLSLYF